MNDFTKEELRNIADAILYAIPTLDCRKEALISIRDKVKIMIDNYCEHKWEHEVINAIYCPHCQMTVKSLFQENDMKNDNQ